ELNWYQHRIEQEQLRPEQKSAERIEALRLEAQQREKSLLRVLGDLSRTETGSATSPQGVVPFEGIRGHLGAHTSLLEYFISGDRIIAAVLTANALEIIPITTSARVLEAMRLLRFQLGRRQFAHADGSVAQDGMDRATAAHLKTLYDELIAPV